MKYCLDHYNNCVSRSDIKIVDMIFSNIDEHLEIATKNENGKAQEKWGQTQTSSDDNKD